MLQDLESCSVLGAIVGSDVRSERVRSARETATRPVDGMLSLTFLVLIDISGSLVSLVSSVVSLVSLVHSLVSLGAH